MFRTTIRADERTDIAATVASLRREAERTGVPAYVVVALTESVQSTLESLIGRARDMASVSTVMNVEKTFKDRTYEVRLMFGAGGKRSLMQRLADAFRGR